MVYKRGFLHFNVRHHYTFTYCGKGVSSNLFYAGAHHKTRTKAKNTYGAIFRDLLIAQPLPFMEEFSIALFYNSRMDPDNVSSTCKIMLDALKQIEKEGQVVQRGWVHDDSKDYCKGVFLVPDTSLEYNTYEFVIFHLK